MLLYMSTFMMIFQGYFSPLDAKSKNLIELLNEVCVYINFLLLVCFTDFVQDIDAKFLVGYFAIGVIAFNTLVNVSNLIYSLLRKLYLVWVKYYRRL